MPKKLLAEIDQKIALLWSRLQSLQNADGGLKGFYTHDIASGIWSTAEIVHACVKVVGPPAVARLGDARHYLLVNQNADGGWPFRAGGKSITGHHGVVLPVPRPFR